MTGREFTKTGGRAASEGFIPGEVALSVGHNNIQRCPVGWKWVALSEIARLESGHTPSRKHPEYWGGDVHWIGIQDAKAHHGAAIFETTQTTNTLGIENSSARILPAGTVCLSRTASIGYVIVMGRPMATSQDFVNWICSDKLYNRFLVYLFLAEQRSLRRFASGAIHQTIYFPEAKAFHICLPPVEEQKRIVAILDEAFEGLDRAAANAKKNLANARELFDSHLNATFTQKGPGWVEATLAELSKCVSTGPFGSLLHKSDYTENGVPIVNPAHIIDGKIVPETHKTVSEPVARQLAAYQLRIGDVVVGRRGEMGRCAVVTDLEDGWLCGTGCFFVRPTAKVNPAFVAHFIRSEGCRKSLEEMAGGATMPNLSNTSLSNLRVSVPPLKEQDKILIELDSLSSATAELEALYDNKLLSLSELKQSVLQKAFAGELTAALDLAA